MGHFFSRKILFFSGALGLGLTCLGLEPALHITPTGHIHQEVQQTTHSLRFIPHPSKPISLISSSLCLAHEHEVGLKYI